METVKADDKAKFGMLGIHFVMYLFYRSFCYTFFVVDIYPTFSTWIWTSVVNCGLFKCFYAMATIWEH